MIEICRIFGVYDFTPIYVILSNMHATGGISPGKGVAFDPQRAYYSPSEDNPFANAQYVASPGPRIQPKFMDKMVNWFGRIAKKVLPKTTYENSTYRFNFLKNTKNFVRLTAKLNRSLPDNIQSALEKILKKYSGTLTDVDTCKQLQQEIDDLFTHQFADTYLTELHDNNKLFCFDNEKYKGLESLINTRNKNIRDIYKKINGCHQELRNSKLVTDFLSQAIEENKISGSVNKESIHEKLQKELDVKNKLRTQLQGAIKIAETKVNSLKDIRAEIHNPRPRDVEELFKKACQELDAAQNALFLENFKYYNRPSSVWHHLLPAT